MVSAGRKRSVRNLLLAIILVGVTIVLMFTRLGSLFGDDASGPVTGGDNIAPAIPSQPSPPVSTPLTPLPQPVAPNREPEPETTDITFAEFADQYATLRENFRERDSLTALVVNKHVQWEGYVRSVTRHVTAFYVTVWAAPSYGGPSAPITFDHSMEDELYALQQNDYVRFEGVVTRAVGIEGLEIDVIEQTGQ